MAAKGQSSAEKISRWAVAASNMREHLEEMPYVAADLAEITAIDGRRLRVRHLEALDGTPILDVKPVLNGDVSQR